MTLTLLTFVRWLALAVGLAGLGLPARADTEFLPAAAAYKPQVSIANGQLLVRYEVAPGYYLYRSKLGFESATPGVTVGAPAFPVGEDHEDEYFGKQVIYRDRQELQAADLNNSQTWVDEALRHVVTDAITGERQFTGMTVSGRTTAPKNVKPACASRTWLLTTCS